MARKPPASTTILQDLETTFHVSRRELAGLFLYLALMPPEGTLRFANGLIRKDSATTFSLAIDEHTLAHLIDDYFGYMHES